MLSQSVDDEPQPEAELLLQGSRQERGRGHGGGITCTVEGLIELADVLALLQSGSAVTAQLAGETDDVAPHSGVGPGRGLGRKSAGQQDTERGLPGGESVWTKRNVMVQERHHV